MRVKRVPEPPSNVTDESLRQWMWKVADALNGLPEIRRFQGDPNTSGQTGGVGAIGINEASGGTQRLWVNLSGTTTSWSWLSYI